MPEGDSLHRIARRLQLLVGERVEAESPHPRGAATGVARAVDGRVLEHVGAVGKHLVLRFEGGVVVRSHLRMTGRWRVDPRGRASPWPALARPSRHGRGRRRNGTVRCSRWATCRLAGSGRICSRPRRSRARSSRASDVSISRDCWERCSSTSGSSPVSGTCGSPRRSGRRGCLRGQRSATSTDAELSEALTWARDEMRAAVLDARPPRNVYRKAGRPCPRCGEPIRSRGLGDANRTAYWCPACQPTADSAEREGFEPSTSGLPPVTP